MTYQFDPLAPREIDRPTPVDLAVPLDAAEVARLDGAKIFAAPDDPAQWPAYRARLAEWRAASRQTLGHDGAVYAQPEARWAATCFAVAQVWLWDETLYSFEEHRFTPERLLADAEARLGGFDAVVLWHAYPVIGLDDRNQWDFYREVPGLPDLVADLQAAGVRVFVDYNPWDAGTRRAGPDAVELAALVKDLNVDGVFLDTLKEADAELLDALREAKPGLVLEGESKLPTDRIADHAASWAQYFADSPTPGVLKTRWFERRHMQHHVRRWHRDHSEELQSAWLNGAGMMVWEVVFGVWVGWNPRDAATLRRMLAVQRAAADWLVEGRWTPLADIAPAAHEAGVFASAWAKDGATLWTLANRGATPWRGPALPAVPAGRLIPLTQPETGGADLVIPGRGVAALLHLAPEAPEPQWLADLLANPDRLAEAADARFPARLAEPLRPPTAKPVATAPAPAVVVPAGPYVVTQRYRAREVRGYQGAPYVDEWKPLPPRLHDAKTRQRDGALAHRVAVARSSVTAAEFAAFLAATGYGPATAVRWPWTAGTPGDPAGPAVFVDLEDARACCGWMGGRLPTEDEWQLAAETPGWVDDPHRVWNWTESEWTDGRTRFCVLKGGCDWVAAGSEWYFDSGPQPPDFTAVLLRPGFGLGRVATVGFRVAWDLARREPS